MIQVSYIPNILEKAGRRSTEIPFVRLMTIQDCVEASYNTKKNKVISSRHGYVPFCDWSKTFVHDGDELIITPEVRLDVIIFILIVIYYVLQVAALAYSIYAYFTKPGKPSLGGGDDLDDSPTYGWEGIRNTVSTSVPVPVVYGTHRIGGNYIGTWVSTDTEVEDIAPGAGGDFGVYEQCTRIRTRGNNCLNVLIGLCEGPIESVAGITEEHCGNEYAAIDPIGDKILVNGMPVSQLPGIEIYARVGTEDQTPIKGFEDLPTYQDFAQTKELRRMDDGGSILDATTLGDAAEEIRLGFLLPRGLYHVSKKGNYGRATIICWYSIRQHRDDPDVYTGYDPFIISEESLSAQRTELVIKHIPLSKEGDPTWGSPADWKTGDPRTLLPPDKYDIQVMRTGGYITGKRCAADLFWSYMTEIERGGHLSYPFTALLGIRAIATEKLSGSLPIITTLVEGMKVWYAEGEPKIFTSSPAWCLWDLLTNERYGAGRYIEVEHLDLDRFIELDEFCYAQVDDGAGGTENRCTLDVVLDSRQKGYDLIAQLCTTFRCFPAWSNGAIHPIVDKAETPVQLFTMGNIVKGSFKETFNSLQERINTVDIQFLNKDNDYTRETVQTADEEVLIAGDPPKKMEVFMLGITRLTQAVRLAYYHRFLAKYSTKAISFKAAMDAVACQAGDVIKVAHDLPQWAYSGRVHGGTNNTITVREEVILEANKTYNISVRHAATDTIEEKEITSPPGTYAAGDTDNPLQVVGVWDTNPADYDVYAIDVYDDLEPSGAQEEAVAKPFRITSMVKEDRGEIKITAIEYSENIFSEDGITFPEPQYSGLPDTRLPPAPVTDLTAVCSSTYDRVVYVSFNIPDADEDHGIYDHAEVWVSELADTYGPYIQYGQTSSNTYQIRNLIPGHTYRISVVSVSFGNIRAVFALSPTTDILITMPEIPPVPTGLELKGQGNNTVFEGKDVIFAWHDNAKIAMFSALEEEKLGFGTGTQDSYFASYFVSIWFYEPGSDTATVKVREEHVPTNEYIYSFEKNFQDTQYMFDTLGITSKYPTFDPQRRFRIAVAACDIFGRCSETTQLTVNNVHPAKIDVKDDDHPSGFADYRYSWKSVLHWPASTERDITGYQILRAPAGVDGADGEVVYAGIFHEYTEIFEPGGGGAPDVYYYVIAYDSFEKEVAYLSDAATRINME